MHHGQNAVIWLHEEPWLAFLAEPATGGLGKQSEQMQGTIFGKFDVSSVVICPKCSNGVRVTDAPWAKRSDLAAGGASAGVFGCSSHWRARQTVRADAGIWF